MFDELLKLIDVVYEANEQADRSIPLDTIRESLKSTEIQINELNGEVERLTELKDRLTERNAELFLRVEKDTVNPESTDELDEAPESVLEDTSIFKED